MVQNPCRELLIGVEDAEFLTEFRREEELLVHRVDRAGVNRRIVHAIAEFGQNRLNQVGMAHLPFCESAEVCAVMFQGSPDDVAASDVSQPVLVRDNPRGERLDDEPGGRRGLEVVSGARA